MGAASRVCPSCDTPVPADAAFCPTCGAATPTQSQDAIPNDFQQQLTAALADRYRIERELGRGGMAIVYLAHDVRHERPVAVKVLRPELAASVGAERFLREIKLAAKLTHQNVLALYDSGDAHGFLYYVMPYVEGESLRQKLHRERQLPIDEALRLTREIAEGLDYAHEQGIIHRDIKPENILLSRGHPLIADFGIAKAVAKPGATHLTSTGTSVGTPLYMSPEQAAGDPHIDHRSDIYSLGCMLYEMLAGEPPFTGASVQAIIAKHAIEPRPSIRTVRDTVPEAVDEAIKRAMARASVDRVGSAREFVDSMRSQKTAQKPGAYRLGPWALGTSKLARWTSAAYRTAMAALAVVVVVFAARWSMEQLGVLRADRAGSERLSLLVSTEGRAAQPCLSPDGSMIVYVGGDSRRADLFVRRVRGGEPLRLTDDAPFEEYPAFSPDGEWIAFTRVEAVGGERSNWVVPTLGGEPFRVAENARWSAWSPDGSRLAFIESRPGETDALVTTTLDGGERAVVLENEEPYLYLRSPAWSPDGSQIVFVRSLGGISGEIWVVPAGGGTPRRLGRDPATAMASDPVFTPDGTAVIHSSARAGTTNLWRTPLQGGEPQRLTTGAGPDQKPSVARDGSIVYANSRWRSELLAYDLVTFERRALLSHVAYFSDPIVSPDGREVAYSRAEVDGSWHVWVVSLDGLNPRRLTTGEPPQIDPRFSPDGASLVYMTWATPGRVWSVPRNGGPSTALTPEHEDAGYADPSPDGRWLAYARTEGGSTHVYVIPFGGGDARRLTDSPSTLPRWSPDGQWIAFAADRSFERSGIFVIRADGTDERRLTEVGSWPTWFPDGRRIAYSVTGADLRQQVYTVPLDGGAPARMDGIEYQMGWSPFNISPDGKLLVTSDRVHTGDEIWLLEAGS